MYKMICLKNLFQYDIETTDKVRKVLIYAKLENSIGIYISMLKNSSYIVIEMYKKKHGDMMSLWYSYLLVFIYAQNVTGLKIYNGNKLIGQS